MNDYLPSRMNNVAGKLNCKFPALHAICFISSLLEDRTTGLSVSHTKCFFTPKPERNGYKVKKCISFAISVLPLDDVLFQHSFDFS